MYLYSGKIVCADCGNNFRGKKQRNNLTYICSGYHHKRTDCPRFAVKQDELTELVVKHFESIYRYEFDKKKYTEKYGEFNVSDYVERIEVSGKDKSFRIMYIDKSRDSIQTLHEYIV